ncbi:MAG: type II toxin-antitoxin system HicA family toxin [Nitrospirae bacterium]|nr:type II toxin-antitoxin system HicA family toxin [Nitrospirota bacterium]
MNYEPKYWDQLKNLTADDIVRALKKYGYVKDESSGAVHVYLHPQTRNRVTIHYHPRKTYGPNLLKGLLDVIGWSIEDMKKLKLIK